MPVNSIYQAINLRKWSPKFNIRLDKNGKPISPDAISKKNPSFEINLCIEKLREESKDRGGGMTYFSNAFDIARRSWHFKIDFDKEENLSIWLVERGMPVTDERVD